MFFICMDIATCPQGSYHVYIYMYIYIYSNPSIVSCHSITHAKCLLAFWSYLYDWFQEPAFFLNVMLDSLVFNSFVQAATARALIPSSYKHGVEIQIIVLRFNGRICISTYAITLMLWRIQYSDAPLSPLPKQATDWCAMQGLHLGLRALHLLELPYMFANAYIKANLIVSRPVMPHVTTDTEYFPKLAPHPIRCLSNHIGYNKLCL